MASPLETPQAIKDVPVDPAAASMDTVVSCNYLALRRGCTRARHNSLDCMHWPVREYVTEYSRSTFTIIPCSLLLQKLLATQAPLTSRMQVPAAKLPGQVGVLPRQQPLLVLASKACPILHGMLPAYLFLA